MKHPYFAVLLLAAMLLVAAGCGGGEGVFAGGFASGAAAMKKMADDSQDKFLAAVNELNAETAALSAKKEAVENIDVESFINPETIEAVKSLKGREKDPLTYVALASVLANMFWGGKSYGNRKKLRMGAGNAR